MSALSSSYLDDMLMTRLEVRVPAACRLLQSQSKQQRPHMSTLSFARVRCRPDQKHVRDFDSPSYKTVDIISVHGSEKEMAIMRHKKDDRVFAASANSGTPLERRKLVCQKLGGCF